MRERERVDSPLFPLYSNKPGSLQFSESLSEQGSIYYYSDSIQIRWSQFKYRGFSESFSTRWPIHYYYNSSI